MRPGERFDFGGQGAQRKGTVRSGEFAYEGWPCKRPRRAFKVNWGKPNRSLCHVAARKTRPPHPPDLSPSQRATSWPGHVSFAALSFIQEGPCSIMQIDLCGGVFGLPEFAKAPPVQTLASILEVELESPSHQAWRALMGGRGREMGGMRWWADKPSFLGFRCVLFSGQVEVIPIINEALERRMFHFTMPLGSCRSAWAVLVAPAVHQREPAV